MVHGRTRECHFRGTAEHDTVARVKAAADYSCGEQAHWHALLRAALRRDQDWRCDANGLAHMQIMTGRMTVVTG